MSETSAPARITVRIADGVANVEIDNPAQLNALTKFMCGELQELMPRLDADPCVTVIALRGAHGTFCAGASISELDSVLLDPQEDGTSVDQLSRADAAIVAVAKPTIALVDGACMGGGWQIASACDFIVASQRSIFAITPAKIGVIYPRIGIERLVQQVGAAAAKLILLTGESYSATTARDLGLVAEVVANDDFEARCSSLLSSILNNSRFSTYSLKRLVDLTVTNLATADQEWADAWAAMSNGPDMRIGTAAFLERKRPQFSWSPEDPR